jgi:hypothetical protein
VMMMWLENANAIVIFILEFCAGFRRPFDSSQFDDKSPPINAIWRTWRSYGGNTMETITRYGMSASMKTR